jgi:BirA family biotin operon repressor/biotin-[acetyl-CoA-carboxylase] ligase
MDKLLNADKIRASIKSDIRNVEVAEKMRSTNSYGKFYLRDGGITPALILAEEQTEGRGRCGRSFYSPRSTGLYMSILYFSQTSPELAVSATVTASVASALAIEELTGKNVDIKWVNDLYIDGKKAGGILCEAVYCDEKMGVIVGIGINVSTSDFPEFDNNSPTSIGEIDRSLLAARIYDNFMLYNTEDYHQRCLEEYGKRFYLKGRRIAIHRPNGRIDRATALDFDDRGGLVVELDDGGIDLIRSGEVTVRQI